MKLQHDIQEGPPPLEGRLEGERWRLLRQLSRFLEWPMTVLGFCWLALVVVDLTSGLSPFLSVVNVTIWALFLLQFVIEFTLAPRKGAYVRTNWLTALALVVPAFRLVRIVRVARLLRATRGVRLVRVVGTANRGMRALGRVMGRRGLGYALALTLLVNLVGAAGIYAFERDVAGSSIDGFGTALWWTAMTLTTMGADYFPRSAEGRLLGLLLAVYGFAVFGYVTAALASLFIARDAELGEGEVAGAAQIEGLRAEVAALSHRVDRLLEAREPSR